jgi:hypothetical protein
MILSATNTVRKADFYLNEETREVRADLVRYFYWSCPVPDCRVQTLQTAVTDLDRDVETMFLDLQPDARRQIRRAEASDRLRYEYWVNGRADVLDPIRKLQDGFVSFRRLPDPGWRFVDALKQANLLDVSWVCGSDSEVLAWRFYMKAKPRVRPFMGGSKYYLKTTSAERQLVGRATRYLVWRDVVRFRGEEFAVFDHGGWYIGTDPALLQINEFKREFGGRVVEIYNCFQAATRKGRIALWYLGRRSAAQAAKKT